VNIGDVVLSLEREVEGRACGAEGHPGQTFVGEKGEKLDIRIGYLEVCVFVFVRRGKGGSVMGGPLRAFAKDPIMRKYSGMKTVEISTLRDGHEAPESVCA
jgi:hypothetical protein